MIAFCKVPPAFEEAGVRARLAAAAFLDGLPPREPGALIPKTETPGAPGPDGRPRFCRLVEGNAAAVVSGRVLFHYEPGELVGLEAALGAEGTETTLDFAVRADVYDLPDVLEAVRREPPRLAALLETLAWSAVQLRMLLSASIADSRRPNVQFRRVPAGTVLIEQGATDTEVYSMVAGEAEVVVDGRKVGTVREGEVFGEMSRLTGAPRSATVRAATDCEVMVFGGDDFAALAESNPQALLDIARNLSERLANLDRDVSRGK